VRREDGQLLDERKVRDQRRDSNASVEENHSNVGLSAHDRGQGTFQADLSKTSTYVNTESPDQSPPFTPRLQPTKQVDPRLSVSTSVRAWRQLDD